MDNGMRRAIVSVNTCNTKNFGFQDPPPSAREQKGLLLDIERIPYIGRINP